ncbi:MULTISPECIES: hypothetical protein [unclassified Shimia]|uniref:hypothetical protein n=1 Tax=unclassified Shimia TaxID=2630038 RepID=UPI001ADA706B|nr:hypothetical protein [Shimia sp. R9_3]MBO9401040.1 hypothetical protein [Shimia sp. R9_3]
MRFLFSTAIFCTALAACQDVPSSGKGKAKQLATQEDMSAVFGKTLTLNAGQSIVILEDGTLSGSWDGTPIVGTYVMKDGFFCRTLSQGPSGPSAEDCQLFVLDGNQLMGTRNRGEGASFTYTVS